MSSPRSITEVKINPISTASTPVATRPFARFANGADWMHALGDIPLERIVFDPWPGLATEDDLLRLTESGDRLCELIDGTLVEKPVGIWEGVIAARLVTIITNFADAHQLGVVCGPDSPMRMQNKRVRMPDASFISHVRLPKSLEPVPTVSPDLAIEVLSKTNTKREMEQKLAEYFKSGTRLAWIIDPETRTAAIYRDPSTATAIIGVHEYLEGDDVLPGLRFQLSEIFRNLPHASQDA